MFTRTRSALLKFICLVVFSFTVVFATNFNYPAQAQFSFLLQNNNSESPSVINPWWINNKARLCGKLWCDTVEFPFFPNGKLQQLEIAGKSNLDDPLTAKQEVETRATLVQETMIAIYERLTKRLDQLSINELSQSIEELNLQFSDWLINNRKSVYPFTPKVEVGIKNEQTVVYVTEQPELGLSSETILTVNEFDSIANGLPIPELAQQWRDIIRHDYSQSLWGYHFDRVYPWARILMAIGVLLLVAIPVLIINFLSGRIKNLDRQFKIKLRKLQEHIKEEKIASLNNSDQDEDEEEETVKNDDFQPELPNSQRQENNQLPQQKTTITRKLDGIVQNFIFGKIGKNKDFKLNLLTQLKNLTGLLRNLFFWCNFLLIFASLSFIFILFPSFRLMAIFFLSQAILIPLVWMSANILDKFADFLIDFYLNEWAKDGEIMNPSSNRYTLRVSTYSPVLKGATTILFTAIAIYATILLLGINPGVLASAGVAAIFIGFLARNVLEDMLNGILILWTDRYAIGDIINVGAIGGFVENMNLYTTQIRGGEGRLITVPNGQVSLVENLTKDWSRVEFKIEIAYYEDPQKAIAIIEEVAQQMQSEEEWHDKILEPATVLGIDNISHQGILIQTWIKTQPMKQWAVGREFRARIKKAFAKAKIDLGVPQRQVWQQTGEPHQYYNVRHQDGENDNG